MQKHVGAGAVSLTAVNTFAGEGGAELAASLQLQCILHSVLLC